MTKKHRPIPNPNKITERELEFIQGHDNKTLSVMNTNVPMGSKKAKGRMISMSDTFWDMLNVYLAENPTEGSRSSFIVRIVAEYIRTKTSTTL